MKNWMELVLVALVSATVGAGAAAHFVGNLHRAAFDKHLLLERSITVTICKENTLFTSR